jgi:ribosome-associated protein
MTQDAASARKDTQKLQRAIVDGLEDVKAQDIQVFNTEHLSPLFERVIVASGTSNRQTKALASSVRDAVREAGFPKPRMEGEENGEWIIVDCGAAVAHIMQPAIRTYYHLEEIWGDKPVRLKFGAPKPAEARESVAAPAPAKKSARRGAEDEGPSLRRSSAAKIAVKTAEREAKAEKEAARAPTRRAPARKGAPAKAGGARGAGARPATESSAARPPAKSPGARPVAKTAGARPAAKTGARPAVKSATSKPTLKVVGKPAAKKAAGKTAPVRSTASRAPGRKA